MTLHLYIARRFLWSMFLVVAVFCVIFILLDSVEAMASLRGQQVSLMQVLGVVLLHLPNWVYMALPLLVMLSTLLLFVGLARSSELVVIRAAGRPGLATVMGPVLVALVTGALALAVLNPISASTTKTYQLRMAELKGRATSTASFGVNGLWLRQGTGEGQTVINAPATGGDGSLLFDATFFTFDTEGAPARRIAADTARLAPGYWQLRGAKVWDLSGIDENPEASAIAYPEYWLRSNMTSDQLAESFDNAQTISVLDLPAYIAQLEEAGFSARKYRVAFQQELALPLFLMAMVLIGAAFTMRHSRLGNTGLMVLFALLLGFGTFFIHRFALVLGENGQIPELAAAWTAPVAGVLLALGLILHTEDG